MNARQARKAPGAIVGQSAAPGMRLNKAIAGSGLCARRKADELIFAGRIMVNGVVEKNPGRRVSEEDELAFDGKPLLRAQKRICLMLNKPVAVVSTVKDPEGRQTVMDFVPSELRGSRLYPVGRLDFFSEGLLLLTNDGDLALKLAHPRYEHPKIYNVLVRGHVPEEALAAMRAGMTLKDGTKLLPVEASRQKKGRNTMLRLTLRQGINRQIRRMCADLGLVILKLARISQGPLALGELAPGKTRTLDEAEIAELL